MENKYPSKKIFFWDMYLLGKQHKNETTLKNTGYEKSAMNGNFWKVASIYE